MATPTTLPATFVAGNVLTAAQMNNLRGAFRIMQVVQGAKKDAQLASLAANTRLAISGLSVSITPSSTSSKVLILGSVTLGCNDGEPIFLTLRRGGSALSDATGDTSGSRYRTTSGAGTQAMTIPVMYLDSPSTTSSTTYDFEVQHGASVTRSVSVNARFNGDPDSYQGIRAISTITALEISA